MVVRFNELKCINLSPALNDLLHGNIAIQSQTEFCKHIVAGNVVDAAWVRAVTIAGNATKGHIVVCLENDGYP